jgi:type II secretory pathway pseudopilin PulG
MARSRSVSPAAVRAVGFSLVELAIVLVVMGLLAGTAAPFLTRRLARERVKATQAEMASIKEVLVDHYRDHLRLPAPGSGYALPVADLHLPPSAALDEIYAGSAYVYVAVNQGVPRSELVVNGASIGGTSAVLLSRGRNLKFDQTNAKPQDGRFVQWSDSLSFDDVVVVVAQSELEAATSWRRKIRADVAVLDAAASLLAANDDDRNGFVDDGPNDPVGDRDAASDWTRVATAGVTALTAAGLVGEAEHLVDPWGNAYRWDRLQHRFYSCGPDGADNGGSGDDVRA